MSIEKNELQKNNVKKVINLIPGSLVYKGLEREPFNIERLEYNKECFLSRNYTACDELLHNDIQESVVGKVHWLNVTGIGNISEVGKIGKLFNIDNMILEQVLDVSKHSVYNVNEDYLFNDFQMIYLKNGRIIDETISIFLKGNILITFQEQTGDVFESMRTRIYNNEGHIRSKSSVYSYFCILDAMVDHYINVIDRLKIDVEKLELRLMESEKLDNKALHILRKEILIIRISTAPIDKMIQEVMKLKNEPVLTQMAYFDSLSQHLKHTLSEIALINESVDNLFDNYMMTNSNDMNQVMTTLTIFSAIFIPLSFVAGVFGMNFDKLPGINNPYAFIYFLCGCGLTTVIMLVIFKLKKWF